MKFWVRIRSIKFDKHLGPWCAKMCVCIMILLEAYTVQEVELVERLSSSRGMMHWSVLLSNYLYIFVMFPWRDEIWSLISDVWRGREDCAGKSGGLNGQVRWIERGLSGHVGWIVGQTIYRAANQLVILRYVVAFTRIGLELARLVVIRTQERSNSSAMARINCPRNWRGHFEIVSLWNLPLAHHHQSGTQM